MIRSIVWGCLGILALQGPLWAQPGKPQHLVVFDENTSPDEKIRIAASIRPTPAQLRWQKLEVTGFLHFGVNTFTNREWGTGKESPAIFNPTRLDAVQWVNTCKQAGIRQVILTAKHHDGFCLWPTATTRHSVASSPWKGGKGDVVREVAQACQQEQIGFGIYLSPWDMNAPMYGTEAYNDFFVAQLTELLTQYGRVDEVWFDGANGEGPNGKKQVYDFQRYYALIRKLQPDAVIAVMGPDVRWVGTESGYGRETEWSVVPADEMLPEKISANSQQVENFAPVNMMQDDLGSNEEIKQAKSLVWYPAETDVSIRPGWFWHPEENHRVKKAAELMDIYVSSVGRNGVLLLNIPPDTSGRIHVADSMALMEWKQLIDRSMGTNMLARAQSKDLSKKSLAALTDGILETHIPAAPLLSPTGLTLTLGKEAACDMLVLQEDISQGQRVEAFEVHYLAADGWQLLTRGTTIGYKRILTFAPVRTAAIRIKVTASRAAPALAAAGLHLSAAPPAYQDAAAPVEARVADLLPRLTLPEKVNMLGYRSPAVERLGIPAYNWWNEALHGVARAGAATVFPQAIAMAATFNDSLVQQVGSAIANEARAKYNAAYYKGKFIQYMGLTFWSPNINIFRDPRWGRGQETYGEDPYLTATMGRAFVRGLQGTHPTRLQTAAAAKHLAVHSGPEAGRHAFNAVVDEKDLRETYLYAFEKVVGSGVEAVMCAYNRLNGAPCCTNTSLMQQILRKEWGFKGHVVTDCGALDDIVNFHKVSNDRPAVAAAAIQSGVHLDCGDFFQKNLPAALERKLLSPQQIDSALAPLLRTQFRLGLFDPESHRPFGHIRQDSVQSSHNLQLARKAAQQSIVLLHNDKGLLPLSRSKYGSIMVLGANAGSLEAMLGNYHGMSGNVVTIAEGITAAAGPSIAVQYDLGSNYTDTTRLGGIWAAGESDISIAVIGLSPVYEGEEGDAFLAAYGGDKLSLSIPPAHIALLRALRKKGKPVVVVLTAGSNIDVSAVVPYADAVVLAWYPGEQGGHAVADVLFGKVAPSGRLPVTFYKQLSDLPAYDNYSMQGRTYRYFGKEVQYPFGFGLSYTSFDYSWLSRPKAAYTAQDTLEIQVAVHNSGTYAADEVVQAYIRYPQGQRMPLKELKAYQRLALAQGATGTCTLRIPLSDLQKWDMEKNTWQLYAGTYTIEVGSHSGDARLSASFVAGK